MVARLVINNFAEIKFSFNRFIYTSLFYPCFHLINYMRNNVNIRIIIIHIFNNI